ncbi:MAG: hypothetical protein GXP13_10680 [Gammaproteobacteria bacterium]|nr:hypothetical protein [Gammaproteobacteria bacterium]
MSKQILFSIIETPRHPRLEDLYARCGIQNIKLPSIRKANAKLKSTLPDIVMAEFIYAYGSNYSGVHISNLDVFLVTLLKYQANTRVIVIVDKSEREFVDKLNDIYPIHAIFQYPVHEAEIEKILLSGSDK